MQNGLVFFFLVAILLRNYVVEKNQEKQNNLLIAPRLKLLFISIALVACLSLTFFSALKAASKFFVYQAEKQESFEVATSYYKNAIFLDPANSLANYSYGIRLLKERNYFDSASQIQQSVEKGLNASVSYSYLVSSQLSANQIQPALKTNSDAIKIFPYSVFLRVRYAAMLKKLHREEEFNEQFKIAEQLNKRQARSWILLINKGALALAQESLNNKEILSLTELHPNQAINSIWVGQ
jgi:predicted Zn-dependent protease